MNNIKRLLICFGAGVLLQGGIYFYLDQVLFSPDSNFYVTGVNKEKTTDGSEHFGEVADKENRFYSYDRKYMAVAREDRVTIYEAGNKENVQKINLKGKFVSFFEWLPDRNLILMALYNPKKTSDDSEIIIAQYNPLKPNHELDTTIEEAPVGSKVTDIAYSTATNVVYMKMKVADNKYRIYRTDANYDTRRIYTQAEKIGKIAVFYDEDVFFYDDATEGVIYVFFGETSGWRIISPPGFYRLVGVDQRRNIYAARVDKNGKADLLTVGYLGVGFKTVAELTETVDFAELTVPFIQEKMSEPKTDLAPNSDSKKN